MHVLIPYASSAAEAPQALWPTLALPNLARTLDRMAFQPGTDRTAPDERSLSTPAERHLATLLGLPATDGHIPWAAWQRLREGLPAAPDQPWARLTLCHWQVTTQQVRLLPPQDLAVTPGESEELRATLGDFFRDDGLALEATGRPGEWMATGELLRALPCASLDRLLEPGVDAALLGNSPDPAARTLRRLQNETQMLLYTHPINDRRAEQRRPPINAFVLTGAGAWPAQAAQAPTPGAPALPLHHWNGQDACPVALDTPGVLQIDSLREHALHEDWHGWAQAWQQLDALLERPEWQAASRRSDFTLTLGGSARSQTWQGQAGSGWQSLLQKFKARRGYSASLAEVRAL